MVACYINVKGGGGGVFSSKPYVTTSLTNTHYKLARCKGGGDEIGDMMKYFGELRGNAKCLKGHEIFELFYFQI